MIHVMNKFVIDTDGRQYIVGKLASRKTKEGATEEYIKDATYFTSISRAVEDVCRRVRMEAIARTDGDLEAACKAIHAADTRLIKALGVFAEIEVKPR